MNWGCGWALEVSRSECSQLWFHIHQALQCELVATVCTSVLDILVCTDVPVMVSYSSGIVM